MYCGTGVQNPHKFRAGTKHVVPVPWVLWPRAYRTSRSSGNRYECRTELPQVPGTGMNSPKELTEVLCRGTPGVRFVRTLKNTTFEDFVEIHVYKLFVILRSRVLLVCVFVKDTGRRLPLQLHCTRVDKVVLFNLRTETVKPVELISLQ